MLLLSCGLILLLVFLTGDELAAEPVEEVVDVEELSALLRVQLQQGLFVCRFIYLR